MTLVFIRNYSKIIKQALNLESGKALKLSHAIASQYEIFLSPLSSLLLSELYSKNILRKINENDTLTLSYSQLLCIDISFLKLGEE